MKRKIIVAVIALAIVAGLVGLYLYSKKTPDIVQDKPDVAVSAKELIAAFNNDSVAARKTYIDKVVEVTGPVKSIDSANAVVLGEEGSASVVVIGLDRRHLDDYRNVKVGQMAVMQGICSGYEKQAAGGDPNDLLASLGGTTVQLRSAGVKSNK